MKKCVCVITPSWLIKKKKDFIDGVKNLEKLGFRIENKKYLTRIPSVEEKAAQIHRAFLNHKIGIVLAQRGGYSSMKVLPHVNFNIIRRHPKTFAGFSDLSTLLNVIYEKTGLVTLHSPMVVNFSSPSRFTVDSFLNAVNGFPEKNLFKNAPVKVLHGGIAGGILKGGNLITLTALIGTKWEITTEGAILFFEEADEKPHGIDRCLTQWIMSGKFKNIRGLILGDFRGCRTEEVYKVISGQMKTKFPVVSCPYIGHVKNKLTLPVGAYLKLNTHKKSLVFSGPELASQ